MITWKINTSSGPFFGVHYRNTEKFKLISKSDYRVDRVKSLEAPVGTGPEMVTTHQFVYNRKDEQPKNKKDVPTQIETTTVFDAHGNKTIYDYDQRRRLTCITCLTSDGITPYSQEKYIWKDKKGNLKGKIFSDGQNTIHHAKFYSYDHKGNVLKSTLYGCLTGLSCEPVVLNDKEEPQNNGCEYEEKVYTYTKDKFNLVESETNSQGVKISYRYIPKTETVHFFV